MKVPNRGQDDYLSPAEEEFIKRFLSRPETFPPEFWRAVMQKVALDGEPIPQSQIQGFSQLGIKTAIGVDTSESTTSTSYTDLATPGPTITNMANGTYLLIFGCAFANGSGTIAHMAIQTNSDSVTDNDAARNSGGTLDTVYVASVVDLRNDNNNTIIAKYRSSTGGTFSAAFRRLFALRIGN